MNPRAAEGFGGAAGEVADVVGPDAVVVDLSGGGALFAVEAQHHLRARAIERRRNDVATDRAGRLRVDGQELMQLREAAHPLLETFQPVAGTIIPGMILHCLDAWSPGHVLHHSRWATPLPPGCRDLPDHDWVVGCYDY